MKTKHEFRSKSEGIPTLSVKTVGTPRLKGKRGELGSDWLLALRMGFLAICLRCHARLTAADGSICTNAAGCI